MPWCPLCKTEYVDGTDSCPNCGCALTQEPPTRTEERPERGDGPADAPVVIVETENALQTQMAEGMLRSAKIPYSVRMHNDKGIQAIIGYSVFGAAVSVPSALRDRALQAIEPLLNELGGAQAENTETHAGTAAAASEWKSGYTGFGKSSPSGHFDRWNRKYLGRRLTVFIIAALVLIGYFAFNWLLELARRLLGY